LPQVSIEIKRFSKKGSSRLKRGLRAFNPLHTIKIFELVASIGRQSIESVASIP